MTTADRPARAGTTPRDRQTAHQAREARGGSNILTEILGEVMAGMLRLIRSEVALARAEAAASAHLAASALVQLVVAAILIVAGVTCLAAGAVLGFVAAGLAPVWATLLVGALLALLGCGYGQHARSLLLDATRGARRPARNLQQDLETLQTMGKSDGL